MTLPITQPNPFADHDEVERMIEGSLRTFLREWSHCKRWGLRFDKALPAMKRGDALHLCSMAYDLYWANRMPVDGCLERWKEALCAVKGASLAAEAEYYAGRRSSKASRTEALHEILRERDGGNCWVCGSELHSETTIEHKRALSNGGTWSLGNLALAHRECNYNLGRLPLEAKEVARKAIQAAREEMEEG